VGQTDKNKQRQAELERCAKDAHPLAEETIIPHTKNNKQIKGVTKANKTCMFDRFDV